MKKLVKVLVTFLTFVAVFYLTTYTAGILIRKITNSTLVNLAFSLLLAGLAAWFVYRKQGEGRMNLVTSAILGSLLTGAACFIAGFVGPMLFMPGNNMGPMLGIFYTGPAGLVLGIIAGIYYWKTKREEAVEAEDPWKTGHSGLDDSGAS